MTPTSAKATGLFLFIVFILGGCSDLPTAEPSVDREGVTPTLVESPSQAMSSAVQDGLRSLRLAGDVPGFAGMFYGEDGRLHVYVAAEPDRTVRTREETAREVARGLAAQGRATSSSDIVVLSADYDLLRLTRWHREANSLLTLDGVVFTAVDESRNRLRVGVVDEATRLKAEALLLDLEIPLHAVIIDDAEPVTTMGGHTLRDRVRPLAGGLQIVWERPGVGFFVCTLGANVLMDGRGRSAPHFLTNGHCSAERSAVTGTVYWQHVPPQFIPPPAPATAIGVEIADPPFFTEADNPNCPPGRVCRLSDALLAEYGRGGDFEDVSVTFGSIYRTKSFGTGNSAGSLQIEEDAPPRFRIVDQVAFPLGGETLDKMGRTTGWTRGPVLFTCANVNVSGTNVTMLCQDIVQAAAAGGDSGSPVFRQLEDPQNVEFFGLLWGGGSIGGQLVHVFSAVENIQGELGMFRTH